MKSMLTLTLAGAFAVAASLSFAQGTAPATPAAGTGHPAGQLAAGTDEGMQHQGRPE